MMPPPAPVQNAVAYSASGDYQTVVPAPGNGTATVSGTGNTIDAPGGIQTITVTGPGNAITTGRYNDTITLHSTGNTVDGGGGNDTIILAYKPTKPGTISTDPAANAPLASAGNVLVAPAPGTGTLTIVGALATNDRIDLTRAMSGIGGYLPGDDLRPYVTTASAQGGRTVSIGGKVIVILHGSAPSGQLDRFLTAH